MLDIMYIVYRRERVMDSVNTTEARENLAEVINRVTYAKDRVRITRRGKQVAAMVPIEDLELLERLEDEIDIREAKKALADARKHGTIPWETAKKELGL
jgi:prevent-host-death family protein